MPLISYMRKTLFIADLHLSAERDDITRCFVDFLHKLDQQTEALYILGDLFEVWIGDDDISPFTSQIANEIAKLSDKHIPVYFIHGNRDFLLRKRFAEKAKFHILPEQHVIDLYGTSTLVMHGDELCTKDIAYQKFRKKARSWWWPNLMLMLPLSWRREIARRGRKTSKLNQEKLTESIMDVTPEEVIRSMQHHNVSQLIHGHTHRPAIHKIEQDGISGQRIVLGDWYEQGSILTATEQGITLESIPFQH